MACGAGADRLVSRICGSSTRVTDSRLNHTWDFADDFLHAPKTTTSQDSRLAYWSFDEASLNKRLQIFAVSGLVHFFNRDKLQRGRINAVTQSPFVRRAIVKQVAEMRIR